MQRVVEWFFDSTSIADITQGKVFSDVDFRFECLVSLSEPFVGQRLSPGFPFHFDGINCASFEQIDVRVDQDE